MKTTYPTLFVSFVFPRSFLLQKRIREETLKKESALEEARRIQEEIDRKEKQEAAEIHKKQMQEKQMQEKQNQEKQIQKKQIQEKQIQEKQIQEKQIKETQTQEEQKQETEKDEKILEFKNRIKQWEEASEEEKTEEEIDSDEESEEVEGDELVGGGGDDADWRKGLDGVCSIELVETIPHAQADVDASKKFDLGHKSIYQVMNQHSLEKITNN
jgi:TolA-binding protein